MVPVMMPPHHENRVTECHVSPVTSHGRPHDLQTFHPVGTPVDGRAPTDPLPK